MTQHGALGWPRRSRGVDEGGHGGSVELFDVTEEVSQQVGGVVPAALLQRGEGHHEVVVVVDPAGIDHDHLPQLGQLGPRLQGLSVCSSSSVITTTEPE